MTLFERLEVETEAARRRFRALPMLEEALRDGINRDLYIAYLGQAYHHVRHTRPLLATAAGRCGPGDDALRDALFEYIAEEDGHENWILDDIAAIGTEEDVTRVLDNEGGPAVRALVGYMYYAIDRISPYAMLGMVYVLELTSTGIAHQAAAAIAQGFGVRPERGFSYLTSHGDIDREHVAFLRGLLDRIDAPATQDVVIDAANMVYRLWGEMFVDLVDEWKERRHAA
jgi:pyrroloquinoline quinone (PQQ) biosynthesis protein C